LCIQVDAAKDDYGRFKDNLMIISYDPELSRSMYICGSLFISIRMTQKWLFQGHFADYLLPFL